MRLRILCSFFCLVLLCANSAFARDRGIYITQSTLQNTKAIKYLIRRSRKVGINTFVIDYNYPNSRYRKNIKLVHQNHIKYVARIVVFPHGGTRAQVGSQSYWQKRYRRVQQAIALGAQEIQLDYVRYRVSQRGSKQNARDIYRVIKWFHDRLQRQGIPLQIDVFGITTKGDSVHIGQSITLFAPIVEAMCPMVYPSHYEPYIHYSRNPYSTVFAALQSMRKQFGGHIPFRVIPFIEASNYRYHLSGAAKIKYIYAQIRAVDDSHVNGWYVWSARNHYNALFRVLELYRVK